MKLRTDKLAFAVYANHGDTCCLTPNCKSLGCASGLDSSDFVLSARFAYLQEAIDYAQAIAKRGVNCKLVSTLCKPKYTSDYTPQMFAAKVA